MSFTDRYRALLVDDIGTVPGNEFERLGHIIVEHSRDEPLARRGQDPKGNPRGHTVDTVSPQASFVAEYSSESDYFTDKDLYKLRHDLSHALKMHPGGKTLWLLSTRQSGPKVYTRVLNMLERVRKCKSVDASVKDALSVADLILADRIRLNESALQKIAQYLPTAARIANENALSDVVPEQPAEYVARVATEAGVRALLESGRVAVLHGPSGIGKSELAARVARRFREDRSLPIMWVHARSIRGANDLFAYHLRRGGEAINVIGAMRAAPALLVLDDASEALDEAKVLSAIGPASYLMVTRKERLGRPSEVQVEPLSADECKALANAHGRAPNDQQFEKVFRAIGGSPLLWLTLSGLAAEMDVGWESLLEALGELPDNQDGAKLADRLIGPLVVKAQRELAFLAWVGQSHVSDALCIAAVKEIGLARLRRYSVIARRRFGFSAIHEFYSTLVLMDNRVVSARDALEVEFVAALSAFLHERMAEKSLEFLSVCYAHQPLLVRYARTGAVAIRYGYMCATPPGALDLGLLGDVPLEDAAAPAYPIQEVVFYLELLENAYRCFKARGDEASGVQWLSERLGFYDRLLAGADSVTAQRILHHKGKALFRIGEKDEAFACFLAAASGDTPYPGAYLQVARSYLDRGDVDAAVHFYELLLTTAEQARDPVSASTLLGACLDFSRDELRFTTGRWTAERHQFLGTAIGAAVATGTSFRQGFEAFASMAKVWSYRFPQVLKKTLSSLPPLAVLDPGDDHRLGQAIGEVLLVAAGDEQDPNSREEMLRHGLALLERVPNPADYYVQRMGRALVHLGRYQDAIDKLNPLTTEVGYYWTAKAYKALDDCDKALDFVNRAIASVGKKKALLAAYYDFRADLQKEKGDRAGAAADYELAISFADNEKYRETLRSKRIAVDEES